MKFRGQYAFLSNFAPVELRMRGVTYPSVEHAFQAAKTLDLDARARIAAASPAQAKALGRRVTLRDGWNEMRLNVMLEMLRRKFAQDPYRTLLLQTGDLELAEDNDWGDRFWGRSGGTGENHLGRLLMQVRDELK